MDSSPPVSSVHGDSPGKNTGMGYRFLLHEIFPNLVKKFYTAKETINKMKRQLNEEGKIFENYMVGKELIPNIYKQLT